ncbi:MAG: hypothetical protein J6Q59_06860 [Paludibacteraceae bacterium]|nr:hypothetical protein [Paludibacteraceae bacterium]
MIEAKADTVLEGKGAFLYVAKWLNLLPAADVVEVTRCKNCKYCFDAIMGGMWCEHPDNIMPLGSNPDDFCSYGEPKEGQNGE